MKKQPHHETFVKRLWTRYIPMLASLYIVICVGGVFYAHSHGFSGWFFPTYYVALALSFIVIFGFYFAVEYRNSIPSRALRLELLAIKRLQKIDD